MAKGTNEIVVKTLYLNNVVKSLRYYLKNILYILVANSIILFVYYSNMIRINYRSFILGFSSNVNTFNVLYLGSLLSIVTILKVILYGNTITIMRKNTVNDILNLMTLCASRFLNVLGTLLTYYVLVALFTLIGVLPGFFFAFWYSFGIFLSAVGDSNNKIATSKTGDINIPIGIKALDRSKQMLNGNLWKFILATTSAICIVGAIGWGMTALIGLYNIKFTKDIQLFIRLCIWDIFYIYMAYMFTKLQALEGEAIAEKADKEQKEGELIKKAAKDNTKSKK
ncbi:MAG: hypothetical protein Ta2D_04030 [Rickettsiales bacterium]|nr:MAG: hypothetical protein Ta2D_04030 [Rickettsiales bacterium]